MITEQGADLWLAAAEVIGLGAPAQVSIFLAFTAGDPVLVGPARSRGEITGWEVTGRRLGVDLRYHVYLAVTPTGDEIEADAGNLEPRLRSG